MGCAPLVMMSLTLMATRSMPTVSCLPMSNASFSLVPTPSVPATRNESPARRGGEGPAGGARHGPHARAERRRQRRRQAAPRPAASGQRQAAARTEGHHAAEAANVGVELLDALDQLVAGIDVHARVLVAQAAAAARRRRRREALLRALLPPPLWAPLRRHSMRAAAAGLPGAGGLHGRRLVRLEQHVARAGICNRLCELSGRCRGQRTGRGVCRGGPRALDSQGLCAAACAAMSRHWARCSGQRDRAEAAAGVAQQPKVPRRTEMGDASGLGLARTPLALRSLPGVRWISLRPLPAPTSASLPSTLT